MNAREYVDHLEQVAQKSKGTPEEASTREVADYSRAFFDITHGQRASIIFFSLPMYIEVMHQSIEEYCAASEGTKLSALETEYVQNFKLKLADILIHLDEIVPDTFSQDRPVEVYRDLKKDDA